MKRARKVLLYFLSHKQLNRTEIMKYLYLYEYIYRKHTGKPGTELNFVRWEFGPFDAAVYDILDALKFEGVVSSEVFSNYYGNPTYIYETSRDFSGDVDLDETERDVADYVLYELSNKSYQAMINVVYSTPPMLKILATEEQSDRKLFGEALPMNETKGVFKRTREGREAAIQRLSQQNFFNREVSHEYSNVILEEFQMFEPLRRRVQDCLSKN